jgi:hypothetical protein
MDVKSSFLNGVSKEEVYVEQPPCFETSGLEKKVCKLKKELYGLKQAHMAWYIHIDSYLLSNSCEPTFYIEVNNQDEIIIILLYVDDLVFT